MSTNTGPHEPTRNENSSPVDDAPAEGFVRGATNGTIHGSVVTTHEQSGGQAAHTINNYHGTPPTDEPVRVEGKLEMAGDLELITAIGCPGMGLKVICRGSRPAKIQSAHLHVDGVDVMGGMQQGFGADFNYTPLKNSTQILAVELIPLSRPTSQEGYVLNRDDVARFFYPLPMPSTMLALQARPEDLSLVIRFFDDSEQPVISGQEIRTVLEQVFRFFQKRPGHLKVEVRMAVKVKSTTPLHPDTADLIGKVNTSCVPVVDPTGPPTPKDRERRRHEPESV